MKTLFRDIELVNEGCVEKCNVVIDNEVIALVTKTTVDEAKVDRVVDGKDKLLLPGVIDDQVHFRDPGLTEKGDIASESAAAVAGGVTTYMDMPNTKPQTTTKEALEAKYARAAEVSVANYSFYIGATNDNLATIVSTDFSNVCGIKLFMGSSTGNMLVDNEESLSRLFEAASAIIAAHCEDEAIIRANTALAREKYGDDVPWRCHSEIRSGEACYRSSSKAAALARKYGARLHILHLSTAREVELLDEGPLADRKITGEVCVHHLWFTDRDYATHGSRIKWNPAIKTEDDRSALRKALKEGRIAVVATDHAPHTDAEKGGTYFNTPSGGPMVQHSLVAMLEMAQQGLWSYADVVRSMCHAPAELFGVENRGFVRKGYKADLVVVEREKWTVSKDNLLYKCKWSPMEGVTFSHRVAQTYVNGQLAYDGTTVDRTVRGQRLTFKR